jgi:Phage integrase family
VDELAEWNARSQGLRARWHERYPRGGEPVFLSKHRQIRRQSAANVARRLKTAIERANLKLSELGIEPISKRVTPHSLRRTFASLRAANGDDPVYIAEQLGHTDPRFTLTVYTKAVKWRAKLSGAYLAEYERALAWAALPTDEKALKGTGAHSEGIGRRKGSPNYPRIRPSRAIIKTSRRLGGVATQRPAKPFTPVRFR